MVVSAHTQFSLLNVFDGAICKIIHLTHKRNDLRLLTECEESTVLASMCCVAEMST